MSDYKLFYMTCKNKVEANKIAYDLVKKDLVACANIIPSVKSYFKIKKLKSSFHFWLPNRDDDSSERVHSEFL